MAIGSTSFPAQLNPTHFNSSSSFIFFKPTFHSHGEWGEHCANLELDTFGVGKLYLIIALVDIIISRN